MCRNLPDNVIGYGIGSSWLEIVSDSNYSVVNVLLLIAAAVAEHSAAVAHEFVAVGGNRNADGLLRNGLLQSVLVEARDVDVAFHSGDKFEASAPGVAAVDRTKVRPVSFGVNTAIAYNKIVGAAGPSALAAEAIRRAIDDF